MANKRIFEIAKELGIKSKAIVEKCHAEGIPKDVIKNHMSSVSIGLEQTIREWFANESEGEENPHTAVEQAEKVDMDKARAKKKAAKRASDDDGGDDSSDDSSTTTADRKSVV